MIGVLIQTQNVWVLRRGSRITTVSLVEEISVTGLATLLRDEQHSSGDR